MKEFIDLINYIPYIIFIGEKNNESKLNYSYDSYYISLAYTVETNNNAKYEYSFTIKRFIIKNKETFEVLGLLQAEMGKTQNGCLVFANSEPKIINKVIKWFEKELEIKIDMWKWYIKLNMQEPLDKEDKQSIENKVLEYWFTKTKIKLENSHPKNVVYTKIAKHYELENYFYGTLMIEFKNNLFSQVFKNFLKIITYNEIDKEKEDYIRSFMKGIIAGEGCVQNHKKSWHYSVHISAVQEDERIIYKNLLKILSIELKIYNDYSETLISKRENLIQLLKQRLMTGHPRKYNKFLKMMKQYPNISQETGYFTGKMDVWHKLSEDKVNMIIELYKSGTIIKGIADKVGVSNITVNRILRKNNLGKRKQKLTEEKRKEIADFTKENTKINIENIAKHFNTNRSVVLRAYHKYYGKRGMGINCRISKDIEYKVIEIYKENPKIKISEIMKRLNISDNTISKIRKKHNLTKLGYKNIVGNNNKNYKKYMI